MNETKELAQSEDALTNIDTKNLITVEMIYENDCMKPNIKYEIRPVDIEDTIPASIHLSDRSTTPPYVN